MFHFNLEKTFKYEVVIHAETTEIEFRPWFCTGQWRMPHWICADPQSQNLNWFFCLSLLRQILTWFAFEECASNVCFHSDSDGWHRTEFIRIEKFSTWIVVCKIIIKIHLILYTAKLLITSFEFNLHLGNSHISLPNSRPSYKIEMYAFCVARLVNFRLCFVEQTQTGFIVFRRVYEKRIQILVCNTSENSSSSSCGPSTPQALVIVGTCITNVRATVVVVSPAIVVVAATANDEIQSFICAWNARERKRDKYSRLSNAKFKVYF